MIIKYYYKDFFHKYNRTNVLEISSSTVGKPARRSKIRNGIVWEAVVEGK
jgi:hypothetical protein